MQCLKDVCDGQNVSLFFGVLEKEVQGGCYDIYEDLYDIRSRGWSSDDSADEAEDLDANYYGGGGDDDDWHSFVDIIETDISIERLVTTDGRTMLEGLRISEGELEEKLIQDHEDPFGKAERGEKDFSGFTGNEVCKTPVFLCTGLIFRAPRESRRRTGIG